MPRNAIVLVKVSFKIGNYQFFLFDAPLIAWNRFLQSEQKQRENMSKEADMYILPPVCIIIMSEILMQKSKIKSF